MRIGKLYLYKKNSRAKPKLVIITAGSYEINGRISNYWNFNYITEDGEISEKEGGDYDNEKWKFEEVKKSEYEIQIKMSSKLFEKLFEEN